LYDYATTQELANFDFYVVYTSSLDSHVGVVMTKQTRRMRVATAILFSLIMAGLLAFGGLLAGMYLWGHFGPPAKDPDDTAAYLSGLLVGGVMALVGGMALLWKFWPRATPGVSQSS
jgi:hypothetical protein